VIAGRVPLMFDIWHSARRYVESGELKLIAGAGPDPLPGAETVAVIDKTYRALRCGLNAVIAPAGVPPAIWRKSPLTFAPSSPRRCSRSGRSPSHQHLGLDAA